MVVVEQGERPTAPHAESTGHVRIAHQPALDGLRGMAVLGVLLFHGGHLEGGYLGVDAFFVLSGFLITSLLLAEAGDRGRISLSAFWARRGRRLLPAVAVVLAAVAVYAAFVAKPDELHTIRGDGLATLFYVANWHQILTSADYFALFRNPSPLQHTWSLAIEEQFYIVWPLIVFVAVRGAQARDAARRILVVSSSLALVSIALAQYFYSNGDGKRVYYGTDTRASSILFGVALAAMLRLWGPVAGRAARRVLEVVAIACGIGLVFAWTNLSGESSTLYRGGLVASGIATAVIIAAAVHPSRGPTSSFLSFLPLRGLGLISYGVYLWHWPIYVWLDGDRAHLTGWPLLLLRMAVTLAVALISYRWLERPIRRGALSTPVLRWLTPAVGVLLVVIIVWSTSGAPNTAIAAGPSKGGVMVVGDSVARSLVPGLQRSGVPAVDRSVVGCSIVPGETTVLTLGRAIDCGDFRNYAQQQRPQFVLLVTGMYEVVDIRPEKDGPVLRPGTAAFARAFSDALQTSIDELSSTGAKVIIPSVPCVAPRHLPAKIKVQTAANPDRLRVENELVRAVGTRAANRDRVLMPDLNAFLCPGGKFVSSIGTTKDARPDGEHFSVDGGIAVGKWLAENVPGLTDTASGSTSTADELAGKLTAKGAFCRFDKVSSTPARREPIASVRCSLRRVPFTLQVFKDAVGRAAYARLATTVACRYALDAGRSSVSYAVHDTWFLGGTDDGVRRAADVLGVAPQTRDCAAASASSSTSSVAP